MSSMFSRYSNSGLLRRVLCSATALLFACDSPAAVQPAVLQWAAQPPAEQGILAPVRVAVDVTDPAGAVLDGVEVTWRVVRGAGGLSAQYDAGNREPAPELPSTLTASTNDSGRASVDWILGPATGAQEIEVSIAGAEPLRHVVEALPGVVYVGVWLASSAEGRRDEMPSDTMRVHASNHLWFVDRDLDRLAAGTLNLRVGGRIRRGPGVDTAWVFHLDPALTSLAHGSTGMCQSKPLLSDDEVEAALATSWRTLCPVLRVHGVEAVPAWYLERLADMPATAAR